MSVLKYLPEKSEYSNRLAKVVDSYGSNMYAVGSAARKVLYGINLTPEDYNFVTPAETLIADLEAEFPGKVTASGERVTVDCEVFTATFNRTNIDDFLLSVRFAGDGLAVNVATGRPIVIPEFMTLPPVTVVREVPETDDQNNKEWMTDHVKTLVEFSDEMYRVVADQVANEPAKS